MRIEYICEKGSQTLALWPSMALLHWLADHIRLVQLRTQSRSSSTLFFKLHRTQSKWMTRWWKWI